MLHFLNQEIAYYPQAGFDQYGRPILSGGVLARARAQLTTDTVTLPNGEVQPIDIKVNVSPSLDISQGDKFTYATVDYKVMSIMESLNGDGSVHHKVIKGQKWRI